MLIKTENSEKILNILKKIKRFVKKYQNFPDYFYIDNFQLYSSHFLFFPGCIAGKTSKLIVPIFFYFFV